MKAIRTIIFAALALAAVSCGSPSKQMEQGQTLSVTSNPEVLVCIDKNIDAQINFIFPEKYFNPKVILEIVPAIVYDGGESTSETIYFQGQKVKDNYPVVSAKGDTLNASAHFTYVEGMEHSYLELRSTAVFGKDGKKRLALPSIKLADGVNTTYMLAHPKYALNFRADEYQDTLHLHTDALVHYEQSSAVIEPSARNRESVHNYDKALKELAANPRIILRGSQILAYASPEGGEEFNDRLSQHRASSARDKWTPMTRGVKLDAPSIESLGQDWEGFKAAVDSSDIADKGLIIRVLSMYEDPARREEEIRNMASVYYELKKDVLPELRRSVYVVNYDFVNYTSEELKEKKAAGETMDEIQLLHLAATTYDLAEKKSYFEEAFRNYASLNAAYGLAIIALAEGKVGEADMYASKLGNEPDALNLRGAIAITKGNRDEAYDLFKQSGLPEAVQGMGYILIDKGQYEEAASTLKGTGSFNEALALLLCGKVDEADALVEPKYPCSSYLKAVIAARKNDAEGVKKNLEKASESDKFKARAEKDIEFALYR
ncbi:MAG: hypothetical protein KBS55_03340 [Bacteroidales bacterium]|nr:hypothetical protein [Candidatus Cryptobacteroides aphodequi]